MRCSSRALGKVQGTGETFIAEIRVRLSMDLLRVGTCMAVLLCLQGCASLCGNNGTREGVWGVTLRCQTSERPASMLATASRRARASYLQVFQHERVPRHTHAR